MTEDKRPHSRACGFMAHPHGSACHSNCPTCGGKDTPAPRTSDGDYDYWDNLEYDYGFSYNEMEGINKAVKQYTARTVVEVLERVMEKKEWYSDSGNADEAVPADVIAEELQKWRSNV